MSNTLSVIQKTGGISISPTRLEEELGRRSVQVNLADVDDIGPECGPSRNGCRDLTKI